MESFLRDQDLDFERCVYSWLFEDCGNMVSENFENFVPILHHQSLIMLYAKKKDKLKILERLMHLPVNMAGLSYWQEAQFYIDQGAKRAYLAGASKEEKEDEDKT